MSNQIWLTPLLGNSRSLLIDRCAKLVSQNQSRGFLYLTASHPLLEIVTHGILDGQRNPGLWGELPVYLFRGFVSRLINTAVDEDGALFPPRIAIDREELPLKRSLISQILLRLLAAKKLKAIAPVANREGCINSIVTLIGEIERAAKSPAELREIISVRRRDLALQPGSNSRESSPQLDFDDDISLIYSTYSEVIQQHEFTEADADQLRALAVLKQSLDGRPVRVPWLGRIQLLVLDGFFDFTPVQGEILRCLIPQIPEVIVNLNHDRNNPEIFLPFLETLAQLKAIARFEEKQFSEYQETKGTLANLRLNLFNSGHQKVEAPGEVDQTESQQIHYYECGDRDTEIQAIAREIKHLVTAEKYKLADIALVVRQRAAYAQTIDRVMRQESVPCNLETRIQATDVPGNRAILKLLSILEQRAEDESFATKISELADLVKSEYFRLGQPDLEVLFTRFEREYSTLLSEGDPPLNAERLKTRYRIGFWDADALENVFAYVGSSLRVNDWLLRAQQLIRELPSAKSTKQLLNIDEGELDREKDLADELENSETAEVKEKDAARKRRPSRHVHPATLAWTVLIVQRLAEHIRQVPRQGTARELRLAMLKLFEHLSFSGQITRPLRGFAEEQELPQVLLNFNSLEALRRALVAAIKSIELGTMPAAGEEATQSSVRLSTFVEEVRRSITSQAQSFGAADRGGLQVLEATDVRGLRFRAVFLAGLIEGGFPLRASRDWIYPHEERARLKRYGLVLEDISPATLLKEEHYFYQVACRATERLYLSRPLTLEDDSETVPSYYLDELRRAIAPETIKFVSIRRDFEGKQIELASTGTELAVALVRQEERHAHGRDKERLWDRGHLEHVFRVALEAGVLSKSALRRLQIEGERWGLRFGAYDGRITDPQLLQLLQQRFGNDFVHSASGFSTFGNCAYKFFAQRVLKLEPRGEAALDLQAIDAGKLLHDILRRFFEQHRGEYLNGLDREVLRAHLAKIADEVFDEHERVVPPLNRQIWEIDREIRKILLDQVLLYELSVQEQAQEKGMVPAYFEIAFGNMNSVARDPASKEEALELKRSTSAGKETIKIRGQIDRVDQALDQTLLAYDYKLSTGSSKEDIATGRSLQIPIYLEALEKLIFPGQPIAGGGYYVIRGRHDRRNRGLHRARAVEYSGLKPSLNNVMDNEEWLEVRRQALDKIWNFLDQMRSGTFLVRPTEKKKTCRFCDFAAVCRYDQYRIERKVESASRETT